MSHCTDARFWGCAFVIASQWHAQKTTRLRGLKLLIFKTQFPTQDGSLKAQGKSPGGQPSTRLVQSQGADTRVV